MTTNILEVLEPISNTHPDWETLYRKLRVNDEIVDNNPETFKAPSGSYSYKNMHLIEKKEDGILWTSITAVGRPCEIEFQSTAKFNLDGSFAKGIMNMFTFRTEPMSSVEVKEYFSQAKYNFSDSDYWDVISNEVDESILKHYKVPSLDDIEDAGENASEYDPKEKDHIVAELTKAHAAKDMPKCRELIYKFFKGTSKSDVKYAFDSLPADMKRPSAMMWKKLLADAKVDFKSNEIIKYHRKLCLKAIGHM